MKKEPIRHHYIPQFILRNFAFDDSGRVLFYNKNLKTVSKIETRDVFMEKNLYRDEINHTSNPTQIEHDLAVYENEVSHIIKKFLSQREIILSEEEDAKLKLFFAIMSFRAKSTAKTFSESLSVRSKKFYKPYQKNGDFMDLWKRTLGYAVKCRSLREILQHPHIDEPFKLFFERDTEGVFGSYFVVVESREADAFILGDCYPVVVSGIPEPGTPFPFSVPLPMYSIFPISSNRVLLQVSNGAAGAQRCATELRECVLMPPIYIPANNTVKIRVKSLFPEEVQNINREILKNATEGFIFKKQPTFVD